MSMYRVCKEGADDVTLAQCMRLSEAKVEGERLCKLLHMTIEIWMGSMLIHTFAVKDVK